MDFRRHHDSTSTTFLTGFATGLFLGALAMFVFDPEQGRRRRALARDTAKDLGNRAYGVAKEAEGFVRGKMGGNGAAPNEQNPIATTGGV